MSDVKFIASRLAEKMEEHGYDDTKLAEKTGIGRTTIYYLRKGRNGKNSSTSAENLAIIAEALRTSSDYFIDKDADPSPNQKKISALIADIVGIAEELSPARQRQLRELGNALIKMDKTTDVNAVYSELMDLLGRLTTLKGGDKALGKIAEYLNSLSLFGATPPSMERRPRKRGRGKPNTESTDEPSQGSE
jgi:transcriptional regulator with XRE-family HTH domain